jgi:hypothetical protein
VHCGPSDIYLWETIEGMVGKSGIDLTTPELIIEYLAKVVWRGITRKYNVSCTRLDM